MDRAVGVVLSAKRFMVRFRSSVVVPYKPDTPVPPDMQPPDIQIHRTSVKEPIRFVYEGVMPYTRNTGLQLKPTMNHLRVPGRPPPNVPQTIIEEDPVLITPPTTPPSPGCGLEPPSVTGFRTGAALCHRGVVWTCPVSPGCGLKPPSVTGFRTGAALCHRGVVWSRRRRQLVDARTRRRGSLLRSSTSWKLTPRTPRTCASNAPESSLNIITDRLTDWHDVLHWLCWTTATHCAIYSCTILRYRRSSAIFRGNQIWYRGVATGGISVYIPPPQISLP